MAKVMIVEDEIDLCETYTDILEIDGHAVASAESSAAAIKQITKFAPDVVLLDLQLPGGSGLLVLSFIRRLSRLRNTKVVIVSGHAEMAQQAVMEWGADLFLAKPISAAALRNTLFKLKVDPVN
jgi:CheY-like chemotaxis protein